MFILALLSCNSNPTKVNEKEKSVSTSVPKEATNFLIYGITVDTLKLIPASGYGSDSCIFYTISGKIKNISDKTFIKAYFEGQLRVKFANKEIIEKNHLTTSFVNGKGYMGFGISEFTTDNKWKPNEAFDFTFQTTGIDKIYANYMPNKVDYRLELKAEDPIGYVFSDIVFQKDLKNQWIFKK